MNEGELGPLLAQYERRMGFRWIRNGFVGTFGALFCGCLTAAAVMMMFDRRGGVFAVVGLVIALFFVAFTWVSLVLLYETFVEGRVSLRVHQHGVEVTTWRRHKRVAYRDIAYLYCEVVKVVDRYNQPVSQHRRFGFRDDADFAVDVETEDRAGMRAGEVFFATARGVVGDVLATRLLAGQDAYFGDVRLSAKELTVVKGAKKVDVVALADVVGMTVDRVEGEIYLEVRGRPKAVKLTYPMLTDASLFERMVRLLWFVAAQGQPLTADDLARDPASVTIPTPNPAVIEAVQADGRQRVGVVFLGLLLLGVGAFALNAAR